jgi:hypothetical protein
MDAEMLFKIFEGSGAIVVLVVAVIYLLMRRRTQRNGGGYVTAKDIEEAVQTSSKLSDVRHQEVLEAFKAMGEQARLDRQNLYEHASDHAIHGGP